ncbi:MAG: hypothetical protein WCA20_18005 [Candidatus Sulfotelmatobacter sp.]
MNAIGICAGALAVVFAVVVAYRMRRMKPEMAGYASQRMCPACGLITPRALAACLECGKVLVSAPVGRQGRARV